MTFYKEFNYIISVLAFSYFPLSVIGILFECYIGAILIAAEMLSSLSKSRISLFNVYLAHNIGRTNPLVSIDLGTRLGIESTTVAVGRLDNE